MTSKKFVRTCLLDLPVLPRERDDATGTDIIRESFVAERQAIKDSKGIRPFVKRWRNLWLLKPGPGKNGSLLEDARKPLDSDVKRLLTGEYDAKRVFQTFSEQRPSFRSVNVRIAAHLLIPEPLLLAHQLAHHYGVGHDLGLVRLYLDTYPNFQSKLRY